MKGVGLTKGQAENVAVGLMRYLVQPDAADIGAPLAIVAIDTEDQCGFTGKAVCLVRIKDVTVVDRTRFAWWVEPFYTFEKPPDCAGLKSVAFDWQIPQEWIDQAAKDAGLPGMAEIWKAVHR